MSFAKEQRYDIHLRSDRTSACLTKANGRLPFGTFDSSGSRPLIWAQKMFVNAGVDPRNARKL